MRWGVVWQYSVWQAVTGAEQLDPAGAALLSDKELALYNASSKPRNLVAYKMRQLISDALHASTDGRVRWSGKKSVCVGGWGGGV